MTDPKPIELDPNIDPWDKQPGETPKKYAQFCYFRDLGRGRTIKQTAEHFRITYRHLRGVAASFKWTERAHAWDAERDRLHQAVWLDERRKAAQDDAKLLSGALGKVANRLIEMKPSELTVSDMTRLLDLVLRHRRALYGDPTSTVAITGPGGDPLKVQLEEFTDLSPDRRRQVIAELVEDVRRRVAAAGGEDDEDG